LVPALVLGDTESITEDLSADFGTTGLTHLTAVSGANLTLLLAFLLLAARWVGVRGWWLRLVGLLGVAMFVALCRTKPSVLRAAAMGLVALAALGTGSVRAGLRHLAVAATVLLLVDPMLSRSVGFALSVLASGGIIWWARRWALALAGWAPRLVAEAVAVPLAAHLATLPVVAALSGAVSVVGLLANALAGPFVGPATVCGFLAAGLSLLSPSLAAVAGFGAAWSAQPILWVAHAGARVPGAALAWPAEPLALTVLGAIALAVGLVLRPLLARRWFCLLAAVGLLAALAVVPRQPGWPPRDWLLVACDIGQGDGLVLRAGPRAAVVVDTGPDPPAIRHCLDRLQIRDVPLLILSHFHADHVDGLPGVLAGRRVGQMWVSPYAFPAQEALAAQRLAAAEGVAVRAPVAGEHGVVGEVTVEVLGPRSVPEPSLGLDGAPRHPETGPESGAENDASLVVRATAGGVRILLTGDIEPSAQAVLLASGVDLGADVLKVPHHGSARQDPDFLAATGARVAVASAGQDNDYGHPAPRTVALLESLGMTVLRTDSQGAVAVTVRQGRLAAVAQR
ncbi:MAG: ComEC/Rec2 family competence protein, partial [Actinomycetes bacterium]